MKVRPEEKIWGGMQHNAGVLSRAEPPPPQSYIMAALEMAKIKKVVLSLITVLTGYLCAVKTSCDFPFLLALLGGSALSLSGAAAMNQWIERERDKKMERTRSRPIPSGRILPTEAAVIGSLLLGSGLCVLLLKTNLLTAVLAAGGAFVYVVIYPILKSRSVLATHAGAICGAIPPLMGWTAATDSVSGAGAAMFVILFIWQIPHFMAESSLFREDFQRGEYRNLPVMDPAGTATGNVIIFHIIALFPAIHLLITHGIIGTTGFLLSSVSGAVFLVVGILFQAKKTRGAAQFLFRYSIFYLSLLLLIIIVSVLV